MDIAQEFKYGSEGSFNSSSRSALAGRSKPSPYYGSASQKARASSASLAQKRQQLEDVKNSRVNNFVGPSTSLSFGPNLSATSPSTGSSGLRSISTPKTRPNTASSSKGSASNRLINFLLEETRNSTSSLPTNSAAASSSAAGMLAAAGPPQSLVSASSGGSNQYLGLARAGFGQSPAPRTRPTTSDGHMPRIGSGAADSTAISAVPLFSPLVSTPGTVNAFASTRNSILINHMHINKSHGANPVATALTMVSNDFSGSGPAPSGGSGGDTGTSILERYERKYGKGVSTISAAQPQPLVQPSTQPKPHPPGGTEPLFTPLFVPASSSQSPPSASPAPSPVPSAPSISSLLASMSSESADPLDEADQDWSAASKLSLAPQRTTPPALTPSPALVQPQAQAAHASPPSGARDVVASLSRALTVPRRVRFADPLTIFHYDLSPHFSGGGGGIAFLSASAHSQRGSSRGGPSKELIAVPAAAAAAAQGAAPRSILKPTPLRAPVTAFASLGPVNNTVTDINTMNNTLTNKSIPPMSSAPRPSSSQMAAPTDRGLPRLSTPAITGYSPGPPQGAKSFGATVPASSGAGAGGMSASGQGAEGVWKRRPKSSSPALPGPGPKVFLPVVNNLIAES